MKRRPRQSRDKAGPEEEILRHAGLVTRSEILAQPTDKVKARPRGGEARLPGHGNLAGVPGDQCDGVEKVPLVKLGVYSISTSVPCFTARVSISGTRVNIRVGARSCIHVRARWECLRLLQRRR